MLSGALSYVPDTEVHDPEDLSVQVRTDSSAWHRKIVSGSHTACGQELRRRLLVGSLRVESYLGELCQDGCFTPFEMSISDRLNHEERAIALGERK